MLKTIQHLLFPASCRFFKEEFPPWAIKDFFGGVGIRSVYHLKCQFLRPVAAGLRCTEESVKGFSRLLGEFGSFGAQWSLELSGGLGCWTLSLVLYPSSLLWLLSCFYPVTHDVKIPKADCLASGQDGQDTTCLSPLEWDNSVVFNLMSHLRGSRKIRIRVSFQV